MAGSSATLAIRIVSDAKGASKGFSDAESRVDKFQRGLDRASVASAGVVAGIGAVAKEAFDAASALQQSTGAIDSVFGDWAVDIEQAAQGAATAVGLAQSAYQDAAALIGSQLNGLGFPIDQNVAKTQELIAVGADLAATFGGTTEDAVAALSSALKGERDPIEAYGITLSQAAVDAKTAAMGLDTSTDAAKRNSDAQATLALIAEQSGGAQGAFAREADTAAGAQQRANAQFENAKAALGEQLLPIVADAMTKFSELTAFMVENEGAVTAIVAVIGALAAGVLIANAAISAYRTIAIVATAMQWLWNAALLANPIGLIVLGIAALIGIVILAYNKFDWFKNIVDSIGDALVWAFDKAKAGIKWVIDKLSFLSGAASWVGDLFGGAATVAVTPVAAGSVSGMFGAAGGPAASYAPLYGAPMTAAGAGGSTGARGSTGGDIHVTINGALDPVAVGRQLDGILRKYAQVSGRQVTTRMSR